VGKINGELVCQQELERFMFQTTHCRFACPAYELSVAIGSPLWGLTAFSSQILQMVSKVVRTPNANAAFAPRILPRPHELPCIIWTVFAIQSIRVMMLNYTVTRTLLVLIAIKLLVFECVGGRKWSKLHEKGARCSVVGKALCYKQEGHGFEIQWSKWILLHLPHPLGRTRSWGSLSL
jgi:hypothetical protein